jgi:hypothetical protein
MGTKCSVLFWIGIALIVVGAIYFMYLGIRAKPKGGETLNAVDGEIPEWLQKVIAALISALTTALPISMLGVGLVAFSLWLSANGYC